MNKHPYLRAYMAGVAMPSVFLLGAMIAFVVIRYVYHFPVPIERVLVFPMAIVPNAWGMWNVLYVAMLGQRHFPIGIFGSGLVLLLAPSAYLVTRLLEFTVPHGVLTVVPYALPIALILYYLLWKHVVGFLNAELGIA